MESKQDYRIIINRGDLYDSFDQFKVLLNIFGRELDVWNYYSSLNISQYRKSIDLIISQISKL